MCTPEALVEQADQAKQLAHCPYSNFPVGAALLSSDGKIYKGCNVENCAYPATICAERTAIVKAVSEGCKKFESIAIITNMQDLPSPCGICRQTMAEFGVKTIYCARADKTYQTYTLEGLLPAAFTPESLESCK